MKRETFFAPDPSHPDRHLKLRGRRWHYARHVPASVSGWDLRGMIQLPLRTTSPEVARLKRDELEKADDLYWSGVIDGIEAQSAEETYRAARTRALGLGFQYLTADQVASTLSIEEVLKRIELVRGTADREAPALLGAQDEPALTVRGAMELYFDTIAADECRGMSAYQLRSRKKIKRYAAESFMSVVGNNPLLENTRADSQKKLRALDRSLRRKGRRQADLAGLRPGANSGPCASCSGPMPTGWRSV